MQNIAQQNQVQFAWEILYHVFGLCVYMRSAAALSRPGASGLSCSRTNALSENALSGYRRKIVVDTFTAIYVDKKMN